MDPSVWIFYPLVWLWEMLDNRPVVSAIFTGVLAASVIITVHLYKLRKEKK